MRFIFFAELIRDIDFFPSSLLVNFALHKCIKETIDYVLCIAVFVLEITAKQILNYSELFTLIIKSMIMHFDLFNL